MTCRVRARALSFGFFSPGCVFSCHDVSWVFAPQLALDAGISLGPMRLLLCEHFRLSRNPLLQSPSLGSFGSLLRCLVLDVRMLALTIGRGFAEFQV